MGGAVTRWVRVGVAGRGLLGRPVSLLDLVTKRGTVEGWWGGGVTLLVGVTERVWVGGWSGMPVRVCEWCRAVLRPAATGRPARFCGPGCRQAAHRARERELDYPLAWQRTALAHGWRPPGPSHQP